MRKKFTQTLKGKAIRFHVDCGATVNVLPAKYVGHEINPTKKVLSMWNKPELKRKVSRSEIQGMARNIP